MTLIAAGTKLKRLLKVKQLSPSMEKNTVKDERSEQDINLGDNLAVSSIIQVCSTRVLYENSSLCQPSKWKICYKNVTV